MDKQQINFLAEKASDGDEQAFEILLKEKSRHILYNAYDILKNHHDAEDAAQEVVVKMYQNIGNLKDPENFNAWLHKIIHNVCISKIRKNKFYKNDLDVESIMDTSFSENLIEKDREFLPHTFVEDDSLSNALLDAIKSLPKRRRRALILYYYEDLSQKEIAEVMDVSESTVATNIMRAKSDVKKKLEKKTGIDIDGALKSQNAKFAALPVLGAVLHSDAVASFGPESIAKLVSFNYNVVPDTSAKQGNNSSSLGVKVAALVTAVGILCGGAYIATSEPFDKENDAPVTEQQTEQPKSDDKAAEKPVAPSFSEDGEVTFTGGDCDCGHENPTEAILEYDEGDNEGDLSFEWAILNGGGKAVSKGSGDIIAIPGSLPVGNYTARFILTDEGGNVLNIERDFERK